MLKPAEHNPRVRRCFVAHFFTGVAALWVFFAGVWWGTRTAGGADSYGYLSQASLWLRGDLVVDQPIARTVPWPDADWTFAPLGYRPGLEPGTIVPIYPSGLPILMALAQAVAGPEGLFLAVPLLGAAMVLAASGLATRMSTPTGGAIAALLLASRSILLMSIMWPMSDVPAAGWWAITLVSAAGTGFLSAAGAGFAAALAILTRPNLVGVTLAPALYLMWRVRRADSDRRRAAARLGVFMVLSMLGCLAVAGINIWLFGSPFRTGYGDVGQVYTSSHIRTNVSSFSTRPLRFEPAMALLGLIGALVVIRRREGREARAIAWLSVGAIALVLGSYAFYGSFLDWWYLRFLLPAYPAAAALGGAGALWLSRQMTSDRWQTLVLGMVTALIMAAGLGEARGRGVYRVRDTESRYEAVAEFVNRALPARAAFFAFQHSGALRHYAGRVTIRFDLLRPEWFDTAITKMRARGYRPYFIVEEPEIALFRARFASASVLGGLDWPPVAELRQPIRVQIFDPADRGKWRSGQRIDTQLIQP